MLSQLRMLKRLPFEHGYLVHEPVQADTVKLLAPSKAYISQVPQPTSKSK